MDCRSYVEPVKKQISPVDYEEVSTVMLAVDGMAARNVLLTSGIA
jgi:hypothetical protein